MHIPEKQIQKEVTIIDQRVNTTITMGIAHINILTWIVTEI